MILLIPVAIVAIACWWVIANAANPFPTPTDPAPVPTTGRGVLAQCTSTGCAHKASALVKESDDLGGDARVVCKGCCDEGSAFGWWEYVGDLRVAA